jgi:DNA polymerase I
MLLEVDDQSQEDSVISKNHDVATNGDQATVTLKFVDLYHEVQDSEPVIHLFGRDSDAERWHIEVHGFYPYFCVHRDISNEVFNSLNNDHRVRSVEFEEDDDLYGDGLWRVEVLEPKHIRELRDEFDDPQEADVKYTDRFLVDTGIKQGFEVPVDARDNPIHYTDIEPVDEDLDVTPRVCTLDIEVQMSDEGHSVVSEEGTELARQPITAITAHDNYEDEYQVWVLVHENWVDDTERISQLHEEIDGVGEVQVFHDERSLLQDFVQYVKVYKFDILTGWNSNNFDIPYLVNRCLKEQGVFSIMEWSPTRDVNTMNGEGKWLNSDLKGIMLFDMMVGVKKTQVHELKSYSLSNVAAELLDIDKLTIGDIDNAWRESPKEFIKYNVRDTEAVVKIDRKIGILAYDGDE